MRTQLPRPEGHGDWSGEESVSDTGFGFTAEESLCTDPSEMLPLEAVAPPKDQLDNSLELNRQLHASLQRKQEEISALKERNAELKELAKQAEHYATVLDVLLPQPEKDCVSHPTSAHTLLTHCSSAEPSEWHFTASENSWLSSDTINTQQQAWTHIHRATRQLWPADYKPSSRCSDHEVNSRSSDHEPYSRSSDHEPCSRSSDHEPYSRSSDHEPYSRSSDHEPYSRSSDHETYSRSSDHEPYSRHSEEEVYSRSSDHNPISGGSKHGPHSSSSNHDPFSSSSNHDPFSSSSDHDPFSRSSDHSFYSKSSDHDPFSNGPNNSTNNSVNSFLGESAGNISPDPKRLKLDLDLLQLNAKQLGCELAQSDHVPLNLAENSPSSKRNYPQSLHSEMIQVYGAFHGLRVVMARGSTTSDLSNSGEQEAVCFKTSIRAHSTVRTNVFPHGKTFTSLTPDGCCRFLWVPNQN